ncbi:MAG: AAA family ATPase [Halanaerobiaceae bacterium]
MFSEDVVGVDGFLPDDNIYLDRFKKGEIGIVEAFKGLTATDRKKNHSTKLKIVPDRENKKEITGEARNNLDNLLADLDYLVGLEHIKEIIKEYIAFIQIQKLREEYHLKSKHVVMHMVFKGNPGTGKTTVARIIGKIFCEIGFLNKGDIVEVERADLVGEYIGHTAQKTKKMVNKARGGVLFVDEAYSLARGGEKDFGKEAIDTLVKAMEDYKDDLIIILAGYRREMNKFLKTNPGLNSRFAIQLDFPDYTIDELVKIAELMYREREYILNKESKHYIYRVLTKIRSQEGINNGNARTVRNLIEKSIRHQASRIINSSNLNRNKLMYITREDLAGEVMKIYD